MCNNHPKHSMNKPTSGVSRRDLIRYGLAAGAGIAALGPFGDKLIRPAAGAPLPNHKRTILIFAYGGYDGLNMMVPIAGEAAQPYQDNRPDIAIDPLNTLSLNGVANFGMHPNMVNINSRFNLGEVACFQKSGYPSNDLSHFNSQDIHSWAVREGFGNLGIGESGWIARYADQYAPTPMGAVSVGIGRPLDFVGGTSNPFLVDRLQNFRFNVDGEYEDNHAHRLTAVQNILAGFSGTGLDQDAAIALQQGHDLAADVQLALEQFVEPTGQAYPTSTPGRYLKDIATLIQYGFEGEIYMTGFGGWDTHGQQGAETGNQANLITRMDQAVGAFADHMEEMGLWDDTLVLISSEFGRRNFQNGSTGTDHGHGNMFYALGGNVNGAYYGNDLTEAELTKPNQNWLGYDIDFRDIYREAVRDHHGEDPALVFPEPQPQTQDLGYI